MEMFELKYFLAVAQTENVNKASVNIHVSSGSLSKAISRLEDELQTPLFFKTGRTIKLTPAGHYLKKKASEILQLEEDVRVELVGKEVGNFNINISSEEILQTGFGVKIIKKISKMFPSAKVTFMIRPEGKVIEQILDGEAHIGLITSETPNNVDSKIIANVEFRTSASKDHPIFKLYNKNEIIPVEDVLLYPFVVPDYPLLGKITKSSSLDGWRDDKFPRKIHYKVCGLKLMENLVKDGLALGYLPDYYQETSGLIPIKISGCPYTCKQTVRLITRDVKALGWLHSLWDEI